MLHIMFSVCVSMGECFFYITDPIECLNFSVNVIILQQNTELANFQSLENGKVSKRAILLFFM